MNFSTPLLRLSAYIIVVLSFSVAALSHAAPGSYVAPASYVADIYRADSIVIAVVDAPESNETSELVDPSDPTALLNAALRAIVPIQFRIENVLKGSADGVVSQTGSYSEKISGFSDHSDYRFWLFDEGSCKHNADVHCFARVVSGRQYLLLLKKDADKWAIADSPKAIEYLPGKDDAWLKEVCRVLSFEADSQDDKVEYCRDVDYWFGHSIRKSD